MYNNDGYTLKSATVQLTSVKRSSDSQASLDTM